MKVQFLHNVEMHGVVYYTKGEVREGTPETDLDETTPGFRVEPSTRPGVPQTANWVNAKLVKVVTREITVSVTVKLTVDVDAWAREFGTDTSAKAVREDVKSYVGNEYLAHHLRDAEVITDVDYK
jgi:hypothetical protein